MISARRFPAAIVVICAHFITGMMILISLDGRALHTTPLALLSLMTDNHAEIVAIILITTALIAAFPFVITVSKEAFVLLIAPQQILLVLHATSAALAIVAGHYPDGYIPAGGSYFILIDQIWLLVIAFWHAIEYAQIP